MRFLPKTMIPITDIETNPAIVLPAETDQNPTSNNGPVFQVFLPFVGNSEFSSSDIVEVKPGTALSDLETAYVNFYLNRYFHFDPSFVAELSAETEIQNYPLFKRGAQTIKQIENIYKSFGISLDPTKLSRVRTQSFMAEKLTDCNCINIGELATKKTFPDSIEINLNPDIKDNKAKDFINAAAFISNFYLPKTEDLSMGEINLRIAALAFQYFEALRQKEISGSGVTDETITDFETYLTTQSMYLGNLEEVDLLIFRELIDKTDTDAYKQMYIDALVKKGASRLINEMKAQGYTQKDLVQYFNGHSELINKFFTTEQIIKSLPGPEYVPQLPAADKLDKVSALWEIVSKEQRAFGMLTVQRSQGVTDTFSIADNDPTNFRGYVWVESENQTLPIISNPEIFYYGNDHKGGTVFVYNKIVTVKKPDGSTMLMDISDKSININWDVEPTGNTRSKWFSAPTIGPNQAADNDKNGPTFKDLEKQTTPAQAFRANNKSVDLERKRWQQKRYS